MEDILIITAAGPKTWLRETIDPRSWVRGIGEGLISDYKEKMTMLREVDDRIHAWTKDFSGLINNINKELKKALSSGRFVDLAILLAYLNKKLKLISNSKKQIENLTEESFKDFDLQSDILNRDEYLERDDLFNSDDGLFSEAGFISDLKRQWVSKKLETEKRKKRKIALEQIVALAKSVVGKVNYYLDLMSKARAYGNIGNYLNYLNEISKEQILFEKKFNVVYKTYLKEFVDRVLAEKKAQEAAEKEQEEVELHEELENRAEEPNVLKDSNDDFSRQTIPGEPIPEAFVQNQEQKNTQKQIDPFDDKKNTVRKIKGPKDLLPDETKTPIKKEKKNKRIDVKEEPLKTRIETSEDEEKKQDENNEVLKKTQDLKFLGRLVLSAKEDNPYKIASIILDYADNLDNIDVETSLKLTRIAEQLIK